MKDKTLSEKVRTITEDTLTESRAKFFFFKTDVKEAVEKLKEELRKNVLFHNSKHFLEEEIDKIFGGFE